MGLKFGNLIRLKGVITYSLSPNELKPFAGMLNPGIQNTLRRFKEVAIPIGVPAFLAYSLYNYAVNEHHRVSRKNPDDYKDEV